MKNSFILVFLCFIMFIIGTLTSAFVTGTIYSKSQATSILKQKGVIVSDADELSYYSNGSFITPLEIEALNKLSFNYKKILVYTMDENLVGQ